MGSGYRGTSSTSSISLEQSLCTAPWSSSHRTEPEKVARVPVTAHSFQLQACSVASPNPTIQSSKYKINLVSHLIFHRHLKPICLLDKEWLHAYRFYLRLTMLISRVFSLPPILINT